MVLVFEGRGGYTLGAGRAEARRRGSAAKQNWQVGCIRTYAGDSRLYLIEWQVAEERFGNHHLAGQPPMSLERCRRWLTGISALPRPFDAGQVAR